MGLSTDDTASVAAQHDSQRPTEGSRNIANAEQFAEHVFPSVPGTLESFSIYIGNRPRAGEGYGAQ
jgi:hypothetical protein